MKCPVCRTTTTWEGNRWRPFCSERCQLTDLGTWASEGYRIAGSRLTDELEQNSDTAPDTEDDTDNE
ncbi:MAG: DNA gyrase inhibitor YacG [Nitrospira sp.]